MGLSDDEYYYWITPAFMDCPTTVWALERRALAATGDGVSEQKLWRKVSLDRVPDLYNLGDMMAVFE